MDKTQHSKWDKTQNVTKLKKNENVTKPKNSKCHKTWKQWQQ